MVHRGEEWDGKFVLWLVPPEVEKLPEEITRDQGTHTHTHTPLPASALPACCLSSPLLTSVHCPSTGMILEWGRDPWTGRSVYSPGILYRQVRPTTHHHLPADFCTRISPCLTTDSCYSSACLLSVCPPPCLLAVEQVMAQSQVLPPSEKEPHPSGIANIVPEVRPSSPHSHTSHTLDMRLHAEPHTPLS